MSRHFLTLQSYKELGAEPGDILVQNDKSATEFGMDELVKDQIFRELTENEAVELSKNQHPEDWA